MGRGQRGDTRFMRPAGPRWVAFRRELFAEWGRGGRPVLCWACGHEVPGPDGGEVQHIVSPAVRLDLAWTRTNLRPIHAGGRKRCPRPGCRLACNSVAASLPAQGEPVPWSPQFIAAALARTEARGRSSTGIGRRAPLPAPGRASRPAPRPGSSQAGRPW